MRGFNVLGVPNILPEIQTSNPITQNKQNLFFERKQVRKQDNPRKSLTPVILHPLIVRDPCACGRSRRVRKPARALFFDSFRTGSGQMHWPGCGSSVQLGEKVGHRCISLMQSCARQAHPCASCFRATEAGLARGLGVVYNLQHHFLIRIQTLSATHN